MTSDALLLKAKEAILQAAELVAEHRRLREAVTQQRAVLRRLIRRPHSKLGIAAESLPASNPSQISFDL